MIDLTPLEVRKKKGDFRRSMRGYDAQGVDDFLDLVADRLEQLVRENAALLERVGSIESQVTDYRERERALTEALVTAQEMREEMRRQMEREVELKVREAEADAEAIRNEAAQIREREEENIRRLRARQGQFVQSYRTFLERELAELEVIAETLDASQEQPAAPPRKRARRSSAQASPAPEAVRPVAPPPAPEPVRPAAPAPTPAPVAPAQPFAAPPELSWPEEPEPPRAATPIAPVMPAVPVMPAPVMPVAPPVVPPQRAPEPEPEPLTLPLSFDEPFEPGPVQGFDSFEPYEPFEREPVVADDIEFAPEPAEEPLEPDEELIDLTRHFQTPEPKAEAPQPEPVHELNLIDEVPPDENDDDDDDGGWVSTLLEGKGD